MLSLCPRQASLVNRAHSTSPQHKPALRALSLAARQPFEVETSVTFHSTNCPVCASPETRGKSFKQVVWGARQPLLSCSEPQGLGQEMGVGGPEGRVDFPRPGDLWGKPPHPSRCGHLLYEFPFQIAAGLLPVCTAGLCEVGTPEAGGRHACSP